MYREDTDSDSDKDKDILTLTMDHQISLCKKHVYKIPSGVATQRGVQKYRSKEVRGRNIKTSLILQTN